MISKKIVVLTALSLALVASVVGARRARTPGEDMTTAAAQLLKEFTPEQLAQVNMPLDDKRRVDWHFIPKKERKGLQLSDMTARQLEATHKLLQAALSEVGYNKTRTIMNLESTLAELEGAEARFRRDPKRYFVTIFGEPKSGTRWGLSFEGHHLSLNFVVEDGQIVSHTPAFFGANPATVKASLNVGPIEGTRVLVDEEQLAFELLNLLNKEERAIAVISDTAPQDLRGGGEAQPPATPPVGLIAKQMNVVQARKLRDLLAAYTSKMPVSVAAETWLTIEEAGFNKIHFAWAGADRPGKGHYYRIQGPTFLVEFCNTQPDPQGNIANHIHSVWRDTKGDFGILLKSHDHD